MKNKDIFAKCYPDGGMTAIPLYMEARAGDGRRQGFTVT